MSIIHNLIERFLFTQSGHSVLEEDKLLIYIFSLIEQSPPRILLEKYNTYKQTSEKEKKLTFVKLYFMVEEFIISNKPPVIKNIYTQQSLRAEIVKHISMQQLNPEAQIIFMPEAKQRFYLYEICIQQIANYLLQSIGSVRINQIVAPFIANTFLSTVIITDKGIDFSKISPNIQTLPLKDIIITFRKIYRGLYEEIFISLGETHALNIVHTTYQFLQKNYDYTITSYFFDIVPEGILENERIAFMSRDSLEEQVLQRTAELEEAKINLAKKVTERTTELEQEKRRVETILKSIGDAVFAVDLSCKIILMNKIAEDLSGYTFAQANGKHYTEIFRFILEDQPNVPYGPFVENIIKTGLKGELNTHTLIVRKDGLKIPIADSAAPIMDLDGTIRGCVVVFRDASRERELERAKDTFVSIAAHQLRTPLGSIRWNIEMLLEGDMGELSPTIKETIEHIYENDKRLITLVNDLLNVSRIDQKKILYDPAPVNIVEVIKDTIKELEGEAKKKSETITFDTEGQESIIVTLDKKRFREVTENLIANAVKYNRENKEVQVRIVHIEDGIRISVADHGIGIPEKDKTNIFSKFFRAENALKSETEGTGLGLFVVKSFVDSLNGSVWFESKENEGTTFYIKLPLK